MQLSLFSTKPPAAKPVQTHLADKIRSVLGPRLPAAAVDDVVDQITGSPVSLKVVRERTSKSGDFRPSHKGAPARITVNGNLNPYAFLITLVHELAHHHVDTDYTKALQKFTLRRKKRPLPHGKEWKEKFQLLMKPYLNPEVFPVDILPVLVQYLVNPKASSSADHHLSKVLKQEDPPDATIRLEELPMDAVFTLHGRRTFQKKERVRTRYRCICLNTNRVYLVSAGAPVVEFPPPQPAPRGAGVLTSDI
ncbi:MAG: sprT domain-containing protein [Bacteroidetes bacterium]|nr:sprT domain-containing protein [Bacteroidota bacterium]